MVCTLFSNDFIIPPSPLTAPVISLSINFRIIKTKPPQTTAPAIGNPTSVTNFKNSSTKLFNIPLEK